MNAFLLWLRVTAAIVVCFLASTVMFGLFLFIPLMVWFWWAKELTAEPERVEAKELDDKFWALVRWNQEN